MHLRYMSLNVGHPGGLPGENSCRHLQNMQIPYKKGPTQLVDLKTGPSHWKLSQNMKTNISCYYLILLVSYMHWNMTKNHLDGKLSLVNPWDHPQSGYPFLWLEV